MPTENKPDAAVKIRGEDYGLLDAFRRERCLSVADAVGVAIRIAKATPPTKVDAAVREYGSTRRREKQPA